VFNASSHRFIASLHRIASSHRFIASIAQLWLQYNITELHQPMDWLGI
jgi:hypothetical protein